MRQYRAGVGTLTVHLSHCPCVVDRIFEAYKAISFSFVRFMITDDPALLQ